jgi:hypothetical protein
MNDLPGALDSTAASSTLLVPFLIAMYLSLLSSDF